MLSKITYREYLLWKEWIDNQWNNPSRTDYYLMQIARMLSSRKCSIDDFRLKFRLRSSKNQKQQSIDVWKSIMGINKDGAGT
ncbi:MAG: hypothetical protein QXI61_06600 [Nitrososphaerota archaeon]